MELNLSKQAISINDIYTTRVEQPIESDVLLPDYCPDIQKILRCEVEAALLAKSITGDKLTIEGMAFVHVHYITEDGCIRHTEYKIPYSRAIELRNSSNNPIINVRQDVEYVNCRAVGPRRLDIRGAVSISIEIIYRNGEQIVCDGVGMGVQLRKDISEHTQVTAQTVRPFSIHEELDIAYGKPSIASIIRCCSIATVTDFKVIVGKVVAKGELGIHILYQSEENPKKLEVMEYSLPLSQIIDVDGVDEDCICEVKFDVISTEILSKHDKDGECRIFSADITIHATVTSHKNIQLCCTTDCYSTEYETKNHQKQITLLKLADIITENHMVKDSIPIAENIHEIIDIWSVCTSSSTKVENGTMVLSGKLKICVFAIDTAEAMTYFEQIIDYTHPISIKQTCDNPMFSPSLDVVSTGFSMNGINEIDIRCELRIMGCVYESMKQMVISDVLMDESHKKQREKNRLYIYFAVKGESVWDIAKHYNTSADTIISENNLEHDELTDNNMLLIPINC